ncbi:hypothetical protein BDV19DRAFT_377970 [Aspergillus venezuelensis]
MLLTSTLLLSTFIVLKTSQSPHGFTRPLRGWNSWGIQATPGTTPSYPSDLGRLINQQCSVLANDADLRHAGYTLCSLDGGWYYTSLTDKYGRVTYNESLFDMPRLGRYLHSQGLKFGLYAQPGIPCEARDKTIFNTNDTCIPDDLSRSAVAFHRTIENSGRRIELDVSSNVYRSEPYWGTWGSSAESIRVDTDINNYGGNTFVNMREVQRTIENYRQFANLQVRDIKSGLGSGSVTLRGNLDTLLVGNLANVTGVTDTQRITLMIYWMSSSSNHLLGLDMTNLDDLGRYLISSPGSIAAADFCAEYPMQPRNPGSGGNEARQLQAWVSGPNEKGEAYVLFSNLGPDLGKGGFVGVGAGRQNVSVSLGDLD